MLVNPADASIAVDLNAMRDTAKALKLELQVIEAQSPTDFRQAFSTTAQRHIEAIVVSAGTLFRANAVEISDLATKQRLPLAGPKEFAVAGSLIGYGYDPGEIYRHAAYFVERILKGRETR